ncbi:hypothetical protein BC835DRAFT_599919 [Cytidiella melzeri]|nr:hypothetical protein BC835DRAFT_599919 [Cytidiella melzeri]
MLLMDIQKSTASALSPSLIYSGLFDYGVLDMFTTAEQTYNELLSPSYLPSVPDALRDSVTYHLREGVVEHFSGIPLALNLTLRQLRIVKDGCRFLGDILRDAYDSATRNIDELERIMNALYGIELRTSSRRIASPLQILRTCSIETCDELCDLVATADAFAVQHIELQDKARRLRDVLLGQLEAVRFRMGAPVVGK